jgi:CheY-like chemotaxis protein
MKDPNQVLVVDDVPANLEIVLEFLSAQGYMITAATSGERALKNLKIRVPDLILLDIRMPGMDGFETCKQIKSNPDTAHIPIIFLTALADTESITKGFAVGAVDYISKPFQEAELLARVKTHLQLQSLNRSLEQQVAERTRELEGTTVQLQQTLNQLQVSQLQLVQQEKSFSASVGAAGKNVSFGKSHGRGCPRDQ